MSSRAGQLERVDFGRSLIRWAGLRISVRTTLVLAILVAVGLALAMTGLSLGSYRVSVPGVLHALRGQPQTSMEGLIVGQWRAPRVVAALVVGAALGLAGAVFQTLTRNPLGSPDVVGFSAGSYAGALIALLVLGAGVASMAVGAVVGGVLTVVVVYLLAWRDGISGLRLIVVGIGVTATLSAVNTWLVMRADLEVAMAAAAWGVGSFASVGWATLTPLLPIIALSAGILLLLSSSLHTIDLGDDAAQALGVCIEQVRMLAALCAVVLVALTTVIAGPIAFIALSAPQIGKRLVRGAGVSLTAAAVTGAVLLLAADVLAQHVIGHALPVGVVTVVLGGAYLGWLLMINTKRSV